MAFGEEHDVKVSFYLGFLSFKYHEGLIFWGLEFPEVENDKITPGFGGVIFEVAVAEIVDFKVVEEEGLAFGVGEEVVEVFNVGGNGEGFDDCVELGGVEVGNIGIQVEEGEEEEEDILIAFLGGLGSGGF